MKKYLKLRCHLPLHIVGFFVPGGVLINIHEIQNLNDQIQICRRRHNLLQDLLASLYHLIN